MAWWLEDVTSRYFGGDILSIPIDNQNLVDISIEISKILFHAYTFGFVPFSLIFFIYLFMVFTYKQND